MHDGLPDESVPDAVKWKAALRAYAWHKRHFPNNHESAALLYAEKHWQRHLPGVETAAQTALRLYEERKRFRLN